MPTPFQALPAGFCRHPGGQGLHPAGHADWQVCAGRGGMGMLAAWMHSSGWHALAATLQHCNKGAPAGQHPDACPRNRAPAALTGPSTGRAGCCRPTAAPGACITGWRSSTLTLRPRWPSTCAARRWLSVMQVWAGGLVTPGQRAGFVGGRGAAGTVCLLGGGAGCRTVHCILPHLALTAPPVLAPHCPPTPQARAASLRRCACGGRWWWCPTRC